MTIVCQDTAEARAKFNRLKQSLLHPHSNPRSATKFNERINLQISKENAYLRSLRRFLPGHEPDRL